MHYFLFFKIKSHYLTLFFTTKNLHHISLKVLEKFPILLEEKIFLLEEFTRNLLEKIFSLLNYNQINKTITLLLLSLH